MSVNEIFKGIGTPASISISIYDTCYYIRHFGGPSDRSRFWRWLQKEQYDDGSWGSPFFLLEDRLINTLSVLSFAIETGVENDLCITAQNFCRQAVRMLSEHVRKPVASELLIPTLWKSAFRKDDFPAEMADITQMANLKLAAIPLDQIASTPTTLLHSIEVLEELPLPWERIAQFVVSNNLGNSPAATACLANKIQDLGLVNTLRALFKSFQGFLPVNYPIEIFELNWIIYFLHLDKAAIPEQYLIHLTKNWSNERGIPWSASFLIPDLDDTAITFLLLKRFGYTPSERVFDQFFDGNRIRCFPGETHPSVTHVAHMVEALTESDQSESQLFKSAIRLITESYKNGFWLDKWHVSPYYATLQVIKSCEIITDKQEEVFQWIINTQQANGGWGCGGSTHEETCYAVLTLFQLRTYVSDIRLVSAIKRAAAYLETTVNDYPELWIDKVLYCPKNIVDAIIEVTKLSIKHHDI